MKGQWALFGAVIMLSMAGLTAYKIFGEHKSEFPKDCSQFKIITDYPYFQGKTSIILNYTSQVDDFCSYNRTGNWDIQDGYCNSKDNITYPIMCLDSSSSDITPEAQKSNTRIELSRGAGVCHGSSDKCDEEWIIYAKGRYVNCSLGEKTTANYSSFGITGEIKSKGQYVVPIDILMEIKNKTGKPVVCGETNSRRYEMEESIQGGANPWMSVGPSETEGNYCSEDLSDSSYANFPYDTYDITCCVDEYCTDYGSGRSYVQCQCDDSLNVTKTKEITCSDIQPGYPRCHPEIK